MKNKKALSGVITMVILVAFVLVLVSIIWVVVKGIIKDNIAESEACSFIFDKVSLNDDYTCYQTNGGFRFSVDVGEIEIESLTVSIIVNGNSNKFELREGASYPRLINFIEGIFQEGLIFPEMNSGRTYVFDTNVRPESIKIAPVVNGIQCEVSDSRLEIRDCF